ncbi:hypothetical protein IW262DRAFT_753447 [Armillaria fumosa]|nr:hypothetical protein IW262DRAFT_753447 [Armillaria fumosa]
MQSPCFATDLLSRRRPAFCCLSHCGPILPVAVLLSSSISFPCVQSKLFHPFARFHRECASICDPRQCASSVPLHGLPTVILGLGENLAADTDRKILTPGHPIVQFPLVRKSESHCTLHRIMSDAVCKSKRGIIVYIHLMYILIFHPDAPADLCPSILTINKSHSALFKNITTQPSCFRLLTAVHLPLYIIEHCAVSVSKIGFLSAFGAFAV